MEKVINDSKGSTREFYKILKGGSGNILPPTMYKRELTFTGDERLSELAAFLGSSFLKNVPSFGSTNEEIDDNLLSTYHLNFSDESSHLWKDFVLETTCEEVSKFIMDLNPRKDPGPMAIPAKFLQYNVEFVAPPY